MKTHSETTHRIRLPATNDEGMRQVITLNKGCGGVNVNMDGELKERRRAMQQCYAYGNVDGFKGEMFTANNNMEC